MLCADCVNWPAPSPSVGNCSNSCNLSPSSFRLLAEAATDECFTQSGRLYSGCDCQMAVTFCVVGEQSCGSRNVCSPSWCGSLRVDLTRLLKGAPIHQVVDAVQSVSGEGIDVNVVTASSDGVGGRLLAGPWRAGEMYTVVIRYGRPVPANLVLLRDELISMYMDNSHDMRPFGLRKSVTELLQTMVYPPAIYPLVASGDPSIVPVDIQDVTRVPVELDWDTIYTDYIKALPTTVTIGGGSSV